MYLYYDHANRSGIPTPSSGRLSAKVRMAMMN